MGAVEMPGGRLRIVWSGALVLALLVAIFPQFALGALGPQLRLDLGIDVADLGIVFAGLYAIAVVGSPLAGPLVDRMGGRRACLAVLALSGAALTAASFAHGRNGLIGAMLPAGAAMALANPATNRWAASAVSRSAQANLVGVAQAGVQAGALVAGGLALANAWGLGWRGALRAGAMLAVVGLALAWRAPPDRVAPARRLGTAQGADDGASSLRWRRLAVYALFMGAATAVVFAYLPTFAVDVAELSVAAAGATTLVYGVTALFCRLGLGPLLSRTRSTVSGLLRLMAVGAAVSIVLIAAGAAVPLTLWLGVILFGATGTTWPAVAFLAAVRTSPPARAGRIAGWVAAGFYLGLWVAPPLAGTVITATGYLPVAVGAAALYLLALLPAATSEV